MTTTAKTNKPLTNSAGEIYDPFSHKEIQDWGFRDDLCHNCHKTNAEISGYLMQCARCKKAYYCTMKCFNEHLPEHAKWCQSGKMMYEPTRRTGDIPRSKVPAEPPKKKESGTYVAKKKEPVVSDDDSSSSSSSSSDGSYTETSGSEVEKEEQYENSGSDDSISIQENADYGQEVTEGSEASNEWDSDDDSETTIEDNNASTMIGYDEESDFEEEDYEEIIRRSGQAYADSDEEVEEEEIIRGSGRAKFDKGEAEDLVTRRMYNGTFEPLIESPSKDPEVVKLRRVDLGSEKQDGRGLTLSPLSGKGGDKSDSAPISPQRKKSGDDDREFMKGSRPPYLKDQVGDDSEDSEDELDLMRRIAANGGQYLPENRGVLKEEVDLRHVESEAEKKNIEFEKPEWAKQRSLRTTSKGERLMRQESLRRKQLAIEDDESKEPEFKRSVPLRQTSRGSRIRRSESLRANRKVKADLSVDSGDKGDKKAPSRQASGERKVKRHHSGKGKNKMKRSNSGDKNKPEFARKVPLRQTSRGARLKRNESLRSKHLPRGEATAKNELLVQVNLRKTDKGEVVLSGGNLAKPISEIKAYVKDGEIYWE